MQIFISYAREDHDAASRIYASLKAIPTVSPWLDKENLLPGVDWEEEILKAIDASQFVLLVLSGNSISKEGFVQKELKECLERLSRFPPGRIFIIPVRLDDCTPRHRQLIRLNWIDLFPSWDDGFSKILAFISKEASANLGVSGTAASPELPNLPLTKRQAKTLLERASAQDVKALQELLFMSRLSPGYWNDPEGLLRELRANFQDSVIIPPPLASRLIEEAHAASEKFQRDESAIQDDIQAAWEQRNRHVEAIFTPLQPYLLSRSACAQKVVSYPYAIYIPFLVNEYLVNRYYGS